MEAASKVLPRTQAFILAGGQGQRLFPLTRDRAKPAVPFGSIHRLIDFTLSNYLNSNITSIRILTQYQCESLHSYIGALSRRARFHNVFEESPLCICPAGGKRFRGTADAVFQNLAVLRDKQTGLVLILSGDHVYRMDYRELVRFHVGCGAEVTVAGVEWPRKTACQFGVLETDSIGRVIRFQEKPQKPTPMLAKASRCLISMGVYIFNARLLVDVLSDDARQDTSHDFGHDIIPGLVRNNLVCVYNFTEATTRFGSYWRDIGTVDAYYRANMELSSGPFVDPYEVAEWPLCNAAPLCPEFRASDHHECVVDSVIPRDVSIGRGSRVFHSVLSPGVRIDDYAEVRNSILLQNVHVGAGARIKRAILDEEVRVADGVEIGYDPNIDRSNSVVTDTGIVVVPRNTRVGRAGSRQPA